MSLKNIFFISIFFHLLAVIFSEGYHRPDEHLGMIHMVTYKLGVFPISDLSWEFPAQIRTWAQPLFYYIILKFCLLLKIQNPFINATILRLFSSIFGLISFYFLWKNSRHLFKSDKGHHFFALLLGTFWYFPFFHARTSTENFSTSAFILGLSILLPFFKELSIIKSRQIFLLGIWWGLAFVFRFQMAFSIAPAMIFLLKEKSFRFKNFTQLSFVIFTVIAINTIIDFWGYGEWTFAPWNYFYQNIILGVASGFGVSPWYHYFTKSFTELGPPLAMPIFFSLLYFLYKGPGHFLNIVFWPNLIVHSLVAHKEMRFIYPLGPLAIFIFAIVFEDLMNEENRLFQFFNQKKIIFKSILWPVIGTNMTLLFLSTTRPAYAPIQLYKTFYQIQGEEKFDEVYTLGVFRDQLVFYLRHPFKQTVVDLSSAKKTLLTEKNKTVWFWTDRFSDYLELMKDNRCSEKYFTYPHWMLNFNFFHWIERSKVWGLIKCQI